MTSKISILHSQGPLTKTERFTEPLRGLLGGRKITPEENVKGKKIFNIWQRVIIGALLFTVGIPYTITAGAILTFSKMKKTSAPSQKPKDSIADKATFPLENKFSAKDLKVLTDFFEGTKINLNAIKVNEDIVNMEDSVLADLLDNMPNVNQPTLFRILKSAETTESHSIEAQTIEFIIIPLEKRKLGCEWEKTTFSLERLLTGDVETTHWRVNISDETFFRDVLDQSNEADLQTVRDLLTGNVFTSSKGLELKLRDNG